MTSDFKQRQKERMGRHWARLTDNERIQRVNEAEADVTALIEKLEAAEKVVEAARRVHADLHRWPFEKEQISPAYWALSGPGGARLVALGNALAALES